MKAIDIGALISLVLSLACIPLLLLVLIPHCLPCRLTAVPEYSRLGGSSISLLIATILFAAQAISDLIARQGTGSTACAVDAILETYFKTAIVAHLPVLALDNSTSIPSPSRPHPHPPSKRRVAIVLVLVYIYAILPIIPTITTAASLDFKLKEGFEKWWGIYCIDRSSWWRIVRPITLGPPLLFAILLSIGALSSLYSNTGHPSFKIHPSKRQWAKTMYMLVCVTAGVSYLIVEQVLGWVWDWWPRTFESGLCLLVFLPYASNYNVWRPYKFWIRLNRPIARPLTELPLTDIGHSKHLVPRDASTARRKATSSFFADAVPWTSLFPRSTITQRPVLGRFITTQPTISQDRSLSTTGGSSIISPPFVYSIAQTIQDITVHPIDTHQALGLSESQTTFPLSRYTPTDVSPSPSSTSTSPPKQSNPTSTSTSLRLIPPPLILYPPTRLSRTAESNISVYSTESNLSSLGSSVTSVFATRHSRGSSLPKIYTPSIRYIHRDRIVERQRGRGDITSVDGEIIFAGSASRQGEGESESAFSSFEASTASTGEDVEFDRISSREDRTGLTLPRKALIPDSPSSWGSKGTFGRIIRSRGGQI